MRLGQSAEIRELFDTGHVDFGVIRREGGHRIVLTLKGALGASVPETLRRGIGVID